MNRSKVIIFSSNRADFGILQPVFEEFFSHKEVDTKLVVTGAMAAKSSEKILKPIQKKYKKRVIKLPIPTRSLKTDDVIQSMGAELQVSHKILKKEKPQAVLLLGDRFEILAVALAAYIHRIPIIHLHGGELTFGALDDGFRHSISKMAHLHFVAHADYKRRLQQLGEDPKNIFVSGAPALEALLDHEPEQTLLEDLKDYAVLTLHPETQSTLTPTEQAKIVTDSLNSFSGAIVCTSANNDLGGEQINKILKTWVKKNPKQRVFVEALGTQKYWSLLKGAQFMIGNSSSGILESAVLNLPVVNIGHRQKGRVRTSNILDVAFDRAQIEEAIYKVQSPVFKSSVQKLKSPFLNENGLRPCEVIFEQVVKFLKSEPGGPKEFFDLL